MASAFDITVKVNGGLFQKNIPETVRRAMVGEAIEKIDQRLMRKGARGSGGKGLGVQRNIVSHEMRPAQMQTTISTTVGGKEHWPRTKGTSWQRKNIAITKAMAPRVLRKAANRIVEEMGG